ncbi:unnamed protein product [Euphydryas editha]|uniref:F-box domain-containing protein n=1 Tax=Euphydryas editha TaxID=104508 RepID=A0AAU9V4M8_EUPED|nr:unnamed protein product [Euphydryas editha]
MTQCYEILGRNDTGKEKHERARDEEYGLWQGVGAYEADTAVVLECVFARLPPAELWRCGAVCRAWRRAAGDRALWRRLLLPRAAPHALRALADTQAAAEHTEGEWSWRAEYGLQAARWRRCGRLPRGAGAAPLQCAALHDDGACLALVDEDAHVTIWEHTRSLVDGDAADEWAMRWSGVASPEWRGAALAQWAPRARRLLLAGRLALVERHETLVLQFDEEWCSRVACRGASGPGAAGCWVDDDTFLSLRLRLLAPRRACTTLWLNSATQEIYSEFAAVTTPLLRIYNEAAAHFSHILVAEVPSEDTTACQTKTNNLTEEFSSEPSASYFCALRPQKISKDKKRKLLIAAGGVAGGARGQAQALVAWALPALELPMMWVDDQLAQRVARRRARPRAPDAAPDHVPSEDDVRALCSAPAAACCLHAQIFGIVLHPSGGCVWATTDAGVSCVSLPALTPLLRLPRAAAPHAPDLPSHYLVPCVDEDYFVTPAGVGSGRVCLWTVRSARRGAQLSHGAPAVAAFLPRGPGAPRAPTDPRAPTAPRAPGAPHAAPAPHATRAPRRLLVLATDGLHVYVGEPTQLSPDFKLRHCVENN